jgi:hypothetical protein
MIALVVDTDCQAMTTVLRLDETACGKSDLIEN